MSMTAREVIAERAEQIQIPWGLRTDDTVISREFAMHLYNVLMTTGKTKTARELLDAIGQQFARPEHS